MSAPSIPPGPTEEKLQDLLRFCGELDVEYWRRMDLRNKVLAEAVRRLLNKEEGAELFAVEALKM